VDVVWSKERPLGLGARQVIEALRRKRPDEEERDGS